MRIVQINAVAEYSSTGRTTSELHEALLDRNIESWIAAPNIHDRDYEIHIGSKLENKFHSIFSRLLGRQGYASYFSTLRLIKRLKKINPDIVHLRNLHANYINLPLLFKYLKENNVPTVLTLHDCWPFTGHCCYFIDSGCSRWQKQCGNCPDIHNWNSSWFFDCTRRNLLNKAKYFGALKNLAVIGVSDWVTSFVPNSILRDAVIVQRIYNWIDLSKFKPLHKKRIYIKDQPFILGVAQVWSYQKGLNDFIKLAELLPDYSFCLVGRVDEAIKDIPQNIRFWGATSNIEQLIELYNKANVFFNPSTRETFGKVTAEALACGTPVVGYDATATPELIGEGCGIIVPPGDIDGAKVAIKEIIEAPHMFGHSRSFAEAMFDKDKLVEEYIKLYKTLIDRR